MSRRSLVFGATMVGGVTVTSLLSSCNWVSSEPATPSPSPLTTPADVPSSETPESDSTSTPRPSPTPSPTPTPPPEQVLHVAGNLGVTGHAGIEPPEDCLDYPSMRAGLLAVNEDLGIEADWAEVWDSIDGGMTWMFRIRRNDRGWVSGSPLTAHDFVSAWRRLLDPNQRDPSAWHLFDIENARGVYSGELPPEDLGVVATDDWTLEVSLERPRQSFPALVASRFLMPVHVADDDTPAGCDSNGPYYFAGVSDGVINLAPHVNYWSGSSNLLEGIEISTEGPSRAVDMFRRGDVDILHLSPADLPRARTDAELRNWLYEATPTRLVCLIPQVDTPPFDDPDIRRALALLIDRSRLELIVEGRVTPAGRLVAEGVFPPLDEMTGMMDVEFDIDSGLELVESSAYPDPAEWPEFGLTIPQGNSYMERVARDLAAQLDENLGIEVPVDLVRMEEYEAGIRERQYPLTWIEWHYRYADPACAYTDLFASFLNPDRPAVWADEEYDDLVRIADTLAEPVERAEIYAQCEALLQNQGVCVPLVHPVDHFLIQQWVRNVPKDGQGRVKQSGPFQTRFTTGISLVRRSE